MPMRLLRRAVPFIKASMRRTRTSERVETSEFHRKKKHTYQNKN